MSVHRALRANTLATAVNFLLALGSAIIIARLLTPKEIGIFSIATSLIGFAHVLRDFGVGQYLVQLKTVTRDDQRAGFAMMLFSSWSMALLMLVTAPLAASFYAQPGIAEVFRVLAGSFALLPFGAHILSMLKREMRFDLVAVVNIINGVISTVVSLLLAWQGYGFTSMAWGTLAGNVANVLMLFALRPEMALMTPRFTGLGNVLTFGGKSTLAALFQQLGGNSADLILGKTISAEAVAQFSRASSPLTMVSAKINEVLLQVFGPAFAKGLREGVSPADLLTRSIQVHTGLYIWMIAMLALVSQSLVLLLFGDQWRQAASLAPWLTAWALLMAPVTLVPTALMSAGGAGPVLRYSLLANAVQMLGMLSSVWLNLEQLVAALLLVRIVLLLVWQRALRMHLDFSSRALWEAVRPSLGLAVRSALPCLLLLMALRHGPWQVGRMLEIALIGLAGSALFLLVLRRSSHPLRQELQRLVPPFAKLLGP